MSEQIRISNKISDILKTLKKDKSYDSFLNEMICWYADRHSIESFKSYIFERNLKEFLLKLQVEGISTELNQYDIEALQCFIEGDRLRAITILINMDRDLLKKVTELVAGSELFINYMLDKQEFYKEILNNQFKEVEVEWEEFKSKYPLEIPPGE